MIFHIMWVGHTEDCVCPSHVTHHLKTRTHYFLKLFVLLYADDTIILAENERDIQIYRFTDC